MKTSELCILNTVTGEVKTVRTFDGVAEAPDWYENSLIVNREGHLYRVDAETGDTVMIDTGSCVNNNNDHVISPDGKYIGISNMFVTPELASYVYKVPVCGGEPVLLTEKSPSFLHGWSVNGEMAYCGMRKRGEKTLVDIYMISENGGEEICLTDGVGYNDGPEYDPTGEFIWFQSTRSGLMQVYRMRRDGSELTRMTEEDANLWFPHVSPDGKKVVGVAFRKGDLRPEQHLPDKQVYLWMMDSDGGNFRKLLDLFGGQGTINVNSWAPDSIRLAFFRYTSE